MFAGARCERSRTRKQEKGRDTTMKKDKKTVKACTPNFSKYAMPKDIRRFVASVFVGVEQYTIKAESAEKAFIGIKSEKTYYTAFDFVYRVKKLNLSTFAESEIAAGRLARKHKTRAIRAVEMSFGSFNYARAAFYAHVLGLFTFGILGFTAKGIANLVASGLVNWKETRKSELTAYHTYQVSASYRAEYHDEKAKMFRKNARTMNKYARLHEALVKENGCVAEK